MQQEKLTCSQCSKKWSRLKSRGRKPLFCPSCVAKNTTPPVQPKASKATVKNSPPKKEQKEQEASTDSLNTKSKIAEVYKALYPVPSKDSDQLRDQGPNGSVWKCSHCGYTITIGVILSDIPTHKCDPNSIRVRTLQRIS
jgi:ribosomal protein L37AE/L43A